MNGSSFRGGARRLASARRGRTESHGRLAQRGQALIEFSFVIVVLMFLVVGVTDIATLLDVHESLVYAARQGARTGAVIGPAANADCAIVGAVHASLLEQPAGLTLNYIYIYQATSSSDGSRGANVYDEYPGSVDCNSSGQIINTQTGSVQAPLANNWPGPNRNNTPFNNPSTIDSVGVELDYSYQFQFNVLGTGAFTAVDYAVFQMNPSGLPTPIPTQTSV